MDYAYVRKLNLVPLSIFIQNIYLIFDFFRGSLKTRSFLDKNNWILKAIKHFSKRVLGVVGERPYHKGVDHDVPNERGGDYRNRSEA